MSHIMSTYLVFYAEIAEPRYVLGPLYELPEHLWLERLVVKVAGHEALAAVQATGGHRVPVFIEQSGLGDVFCLDDALNGHVLWARAGGLRLVLRVLAVPGVTAVGPVPFFLDGLSSHAVRQAFHVSIYNQQGITKHNMVSKMRRNTCSIDICSAVSYRQCSSCSPCTRRWAPSWRSSWRIPCSPRTSRRRSASRWPCPRRSSRSACSRSGAGNWREMWISAG